MPKIVPIFCFMLLQSLLSAQTLNEKQVGASTFFSNPGTRQTHQLFLTRCAYLDLATEHGVNLHWRTNGYCPSLVKYGSDLNNLSETLLDTTPRKNHVMTFHGLAPNHKYYYSFGTGSEIFPADSNNFFYTAPALQSEEKIRFWVTGDFGLAGSEQTAVAQAFFNYNANRKINGWLWLGDNAYNSGTDKEYQNNIFSLFENRLKNIPLFPAPGNHDYGNQAYQSASVLTTNFPYFSIFNLPETSGTEKYYSYNYGNAHFISLDSYGAFNFPGSDMYNWLFNDLKNNRLKWTIVYFHHPPYSKGTHDSDTEQELLDMRHNIVPLLEAYNVDLVLCGHSHNYERSFFMKGHFGQESDFNLAAYPQGNVIQQGPGPFIKSTLQPHGTVYVVNGSGSKVSSWMHPGYPHNAMVKSIENKSGSMLLEMEGDTMTCTFVQSDGIIGDDFQLVKKNRITPIEKSSINNFTVYENEEGGITIKFRNLPPEEDSIELFVTDVSGKQIYRKEHKISGADSKDIKLLKQDLGISKQVCVININRNGKPLKTENLLLK